MNELLTNLPLLIFLVVVINYSVGVFFIVYHLVKFGLDYKTKVLAAFFLIGSSLLILFNFYLLSRVNWAEFIYEYLPFQKII